MITVPRFALNQLMANHSKSSAYKTSQHSDKFLAND